MPDSAKCIAIVDMILGRLNYLPFLLCFIPSILGRVFYKKRFLSDIVFYRGRTNMNIIKRPLGLYKANCYVLIKEGKSIIIDPGFHCNHIIEMVGILNQ